MGHKDVVLRGQGHMYYIYPGKKFRKISVYLSYEYQQNVEISDRTENPVSC